mgnify:CR=1 FL=1
MNCFDLLGCCISCGDTQGPWSWYEGIGWLCEECEESYEERKKTGLECRHDT